QRPATPCQRGSYDPTHMICPKCNYERQEKDSIVPDWQCPKCGLAYAKVQAKLDQVQASVAKAQALLDQRVRMRLTSGAEIIFDKVRLYNLKLVQALDTLRQATARNLAGYSTGLGFWGDLEWVAAGALVTGLIEKSVSNQMENEAANQIVLAAKIA